MTLKEQVTEIIIENMIHEMWAEPASEEYWEDGEVVYHVGYATESLNKTIQAILSQFKEIVEEMTEHTLEFIESYFVTTIQPYGERMHHIDDTEWESIKQKIANHSQQELRKKINEL